MRQAELRQFGHLIYTSDAVSLRTQRKLVLRGIGFDYKWLRMYIIIFIMDLASWDLYSTSDSNTDYNFTKKNELDTQYLVTSADRAILSTVGELVSSWKKWGPMLPKVLGPVRTSKLKNAFNI